MYLKRLEIQGFKSFAKKTTLEFEKGITAIVGPNGSGKSNVADFLRWVLGEQKSSLLRGKKSDDVIFAGSDKKLRLGFAEGIATFDNTDRKISLDSAEVSIGRRVDRSGASEYLINGQAVRLLDVVDLVLKSNIGTSRYTVIGQGTIDQMILSGPAEVKNLLDEASGVKTYYLKRDKSLRRLEQTAQNLMRAEDLLAEIQPRLKSLRRQAKRMEARSEIEAELQTLQAENFGQRHYAADLELSGLNAALAGLEEERRTLEGLLQYHLRQAESAEKFGQEEVAKQERLQARQNRLQNQKNQLLENLSMVRGKMQAHKTSLPGDAASLQVQAHRLEGELAEIAEELAKLGGLRQNQRGRQEELGASLQKSEGLIKQALAGLTQAGSPASADLFLELEALEKVFNELVEELEKPRSENLPARLQNFREKFSALKLKAAASGQSPGADINHNLSELLAQKENFSVALQALLLQISKQQLEEEYLSKRATELQQQKLQVDLELRRSRGQSGEEFMKSLVEEENKLQQQLRALGAEITEASGQLENFYNSQRAQRLSQTESEQQYRKLQQELNRTKDRQSELAVQKARADTQFAGLLLEISQALGPGGLDAVRQRVSEAQGRLSTEAAEEKILKLKKQLEMIGGVDELTLKEYEETEARYARLTEQVADLKAGMQDLRKIIEELDGHIKLKFNQAFHKINQQFEIYFRTLFNGGRAYLSIIRPQADSAQALDAESAEGAVEERQDLRPEEKLLAKYEHEALQVSGIDIRATPPGKKLSSIQALSGGERALTSIALLCSLLTCFPSPFVVLDEVDAALDEANTIRFGQILGKLSGSTQFITITHNRETMAQANTLYGVTMGDDGVTRLLSIKLDEAREYAK